MSWRFDPYPFVSLEILGRMDPQTRKACLLFTKNTTVVPMIENLTNFFRSEHHANSANPIEKATQGKPAAKTAKLS